MGNLAALGLVLAVAACDYTPPNAPTFQSVFDARCSFGSCHAAPTVAAHLDLNADRMCAALVRTPSCLFPQRLRVVPGKPDDSFLISKLTGTQGSDAPASGCGATSNERMPLGGAALPDDELAAIKSWVADGAPCDGAPPTDAGTDADPEAPGIASVSADRAVVSAGETATILVTLTGPAGAAGQPVFLQSQSPALTVPIQVVVPAGATNVVFEAFASRPTPRFTLVASSNASSKDLVMRIAGLDVQEVLNNVTGADTGLEWMKLRNSSSVMIDLARYRLRVGTTSFDFTGGALTGTLAPGACAVIGGPTSSSANGTPVFTQALDFEPDLPNNTAHVKGYAVFEDSPTDDAVPVAAMFVGPSNAELLDPDGRVASPHCAEVPIDDSAVRTAPDRCAPSTPQPNECL